MLRFRNMPIPDFGYASEDWQQREIPSTWRVSPSASEYPVNNRLKDTAVGERPQERLEKFGAAALSDTELLALVLRSGTRGSDVVTVATCLMAEAGSLGGLLAWRGSDFRRLKGIGRIKGYQLTAAMEIARRAL